MQQLRWPVHRRHDKPWKVVAFTYLPSAEQEPGFRIAITGFADSKSMDKSCQVYGNFHAGNPVMIAGRRAYIAAQNRSTERGI